MINNKMIKYKENMFVKIRNFFKNLFHKKSISVNENINDMKSNSSFIENIRIKEDKERIRLKSLQQLYDNGEIDEEDILEEDMDKLIEMYEKETNELNADTERRKNHIVQKLKELKML